MKKYFIFLIILGIFICEIFLNYIPDVGYILYAVLVAFSLIALSSAGSLNNDGKILIALLILPILRIAEVFFGFNFFWNTFVFYLLFGVLAAYYFIRFDFKANFYNISWNFLGISVIIGILLGLAGHYIINFMNDRNILALVPLVAFSEELWLRGMIQNTIKAEYGSSTGILISALIYFIFSFSFGVLPALFFLASALLIGTLYQRTNNITVCIIANLCMTALIFAL